MVLLNNARPPRSPRRKGEKKMVAGSVHPWGTFHGLQWCRIVPVATGIFWRKRTKRRTVQWNCGAGRTVIMKNLVSEDLLLDRHQFTNMATRNSETSFFFFFFLLGLLRGFAPAADPACSVRAAVFDTGNSLRNEWFSILKSACHGSTYIIVTQNAAKLWLLSKRILNLNDVETTSWLPTGADRSRHSYTSSTSTGRACQVDEISYF